MRNKFNRAPEFIEVYRNLSAHTNKSVEDASSFQLMRILVGVYQLNGANLTNIPSEAKVREVLQLSYQDRKIEVVLVNKTTSLAEASSEEVILGEFEINRGLILNPPYDNGQVIYGKSHYTSYILNSYSLLDNTPNYTSLGALSKRALTYYCTIFYIFSVDYATWTIFQ